mmetsp:Transcript_8251/g.12412  ORF Transcript_8251/g.12412 Transcript_8251/m.12412 type:complete len:1746 (-) Transcript_8251:12-5249(-)
MEAKLDFDDMVFMPEFTGPLAVKNVEERFKKNKIYTNVSSILISINPFAKLGLYTEKMYDYYQHNKVADDPPPHVFAVAKTAFNQMLSNEEKKSQSLLISGESGAGKTETTKLFLRYFAKQSAILSGESKDAKEEVSIEARILQANPILEAFGNAKTLRNDNSSRFGRWLNVYFSDKGKIMMSSMTKYLLEESRVVFQDKGERSYNVFYQVCASWEREITAGNTASMDPKNLEYLNKSGCYTVDKVDDYELFEEMMRCFEKLGFSGEEQAAMLRILKAILCLGNVIFEEGPVVKGKGSSVISKKCEAYLKEISTCLCIDLPLVDRVLTIQDLTMPSGTLYSLPREKKAAEASRHALAKSLYGRLFTWLVERINVAFRASYKGTADIESLRIIGILDIFGFEAFKHNSFEQLCINLANEKLQQYFVEQVFKMELKVYKEEKIDVKEIPYPDNSDTLELLEKKGGVFLLLRDELKVKTGTDLAFALKLQKSRRKHPKFVAPRMQNDPTFTIKHFAEPVKYSAIGFLAKNRAKITQDVVDTMRTSTDPIVVKLFADKKADSKDSEKSKSRKGGKRRKKKRGGTSLAAQFQSQLSKLITTIRATESHFVRCIKPNTTKKAMDFDEKEVMRQLTTCGVIDAVTVRKLGYTNRMSHWAFFKKYGIIQGGRVYHSKGVDFKSENKKVCSLAEKDVPEEISKKIPIALWQSGTNIMFYKSELQRSLDKLLRKVQEAAARKIGSIAKMYLQRRRYLEMQSAYRALRATVKNPTCSLEEIDECFKRCKKVGVIERLLKEAEKEIEELIKARDALRKALSTSMSSLTARLKLMVEAIAKASNLIPTAVEFQIIKTVAPKLQELQKLLPVVLAKAYKSEAGAEELLKLISDGEEFCGKFDTLKINLRKKKEIRSAIETVDILNDADEKLKKVTAQRDLLILHSAVKGIEGGVADGKFERKSLLVAKETVEALELELKLEQAISSGVVEEMQKSKELAEKKLSESPHWTGQQGSKLSDQLAQIAKAMALAKSIRDCISRLENATEIAPSMGENALSLLQDALGQARPLLKETLDAKLKGDILTNLTKAMGSTEKLLKSTMESMDTKKQEEAKKAMEEREKRLKEVLEAEKKAEKAEEEARKKEVEQKMAEMQKLAKEEAEKRDEQYTKSLDAEREKYDDKLKAKDSVIDEKESEIQGLKERAEKAELEAKNLRLRLDEFINPSPDDLDAQIRTAILKHSQAIKDPTKLVAWYIAGVFKGLDADPAPISVQLQQLQKLMTRPEVQASGGMPFVENSVRGLTHLQTIKGSERKEEDVVPEDDDYPPTPTDITPPPSPKWKQTRRKSALPSPVALKEARAMVEGLPPPAEAIEAHRKSVMSSVSEIPPPPTHGERESAFISFTIPPPIEESSSDDDFALPPPTNKLSFNVAPPPPPPENPPEEDEPAPLPPPTQKKPPAKRFSLKPKSPKYTKSVSPVSSPSPERKSGKAMLTGHVSHSETAVMESHAKEKKLALSSRKKFLPKTISEDQPTVAAAPLVPNEEMIKRMSRASSTATLMSTRHKPSRSIFGGFTRNKDKRSPTVESNVSKVDHRRNKTSWGRALGSFMGSGKEKRDARASTAGHIATIGDQTSQPDEKSKGRNSLVIVPDISSAPVIREGYLRKKGGINADKALKKRYFKLRRHEGRFYFAYYTGKFEKKELGVIVLTGAIVEPHYKKPKYLQIRQEAMNGAPARLYMIKAESKEHRDIWLNQLLKYSKMTK